MTTKSFLSSEFIDEAQLAKVRHTFGLLEEHLLPEERDEGQPSYRLGWYRRIQAGECTHSDVALFRRFVDEMCERALQRASRTEALFPSPKSPQASAQDSEIYALRARQLCESFCAELGDEF